MGKKNRLTVRALVRVARVCGGMPLLFELGGCSEHVTAILCPDLSSVYPSLCNQCSTMIKYRMENVLGVGASVSIYSPSNDLNLHSGCCFNRVWCFAQSKQVLRRLSLSRHLASHSELSEPFSATRVVFCSSSKGTPRSPPFMDTDNYRTLNICRSNCWDQVSRVLRPVPPSHLWQRSYKLSNKWYNYCSASKV